MPSPTIDRATFAELEQTAGPEFAVELVDTFLVEAPAMLADLRHALAAGDVDAVRRTAHSLKSNGNTFGAQAFAAMARALELGGMASVQTAEGRPLDALDAEYARVASALTELTRD
jgi:HPt (histidine-containing phosphotransfer) domain-containing protein